MKKNIRARRQGLKQRYARGSSLPGALIGGLVVTVVLGAGAYLYNDYKQDQVAQGRGRQLGKALEQLEAYARKYNIALTAGSSVAGVSNPFSPTTLELEELGFSSTSFSDASQPGGPVLYRLAREPAGCEASKCILALQVVTSDSVRTTGIVDNAFAQRIAGHVPKGAGWSTSPSDATKLQKQSNMLPNPHGNRPAVVAAMAWLGNGRASMIVPPPYTESESLACPAGYSGSQEKYRTVTTDKWGSLSYSAWSISGACIPPPPPPLPPEPQPAPEPLPNTPPPGQPPTNTTPGTCGSPNYPACPPVEGTCPNGATNPPICSFPEQQPVCPNPALQWPNCTPPPPPQIVPECYGEDRVETPFPSCNRGTNTTEGVELHEYEICTIAGRVVSEQFRWVREWGERDCFTSQIEWK